MTLSKPFGSKKRRGNPADEAKARRCLRDDRGLLFVSCQKKGDARSVDTM